MPPFSVLMIALNEADRLGAPLRALEFADERLVVDGGSTDRSVAVARAAGARVLSRQFDGFGSQRRYAQTEALHPWILWIDADECPDIALLEALRQFQQASSSPRVSGFWIARQTLYLGRRLRFGASGSSLLRLVTREAARWTDRAVHEELRVDGPTASLPGQLLHRPYRDLDDHLRRIDRYSRLAANEAILTGRLHRPIQLLLNPAWHFVKRYAIQQGFRDGIPGLLMATLGAWQVALKIARQLEPGPQEPPCASP